MPGIDTSKRRTAWILLGCIGVAFAVRIVACAVVSDIGHWEKNHHLEYILAGARLVQYQTLASPLFLDDIDPRPSGLMPPVYALIVAGFYALFGVKSFAATLSLQMLNALSTALVIPPVFVVARDLFGRTTAWFAVAIAMFSPMLFGFAPYIWDTSLFTLGVAVAVWWAHGLGRRPRAWWHWALFGCYLGALAHVNPALTAAYPLLVLWPATKVYGWRSRSVLGKTAIAICGWLIAVTPWTLRNFHHFGTVTYVRTGFVHELWLGACPQADEQPEAVFKKQFPYYNPDVAREVSEIGETAYVRACGRKAMDAIRAEPTRFLGLVGRRAIDFALGTILSHRSGWRMVWPRSNNRKILMLFVTVESLIILAATLTNPRYRKRSGWLLVVIVSFSIVYCLTHVQLRFRAPIEPLVAILVAGAITFGRKTDQRTASLGACNDDARIGGSRITTRRPA